MFAAMSEVKTVLVTGCTGLVGHGICSYLLDEGYRVIGTDRIAPDFQHPMFYFHKCDLKDVWGTLNLMSAMKRADAMIHSAAIIPKGASSYTFDQGEEIFEVNTLATYRLLKQFSATGPKSVVYISGIRLSETVSEEVTEAMPFRASSEYDASKLCGELICRQFESQELLWPSVLRISAPYGYVLESNAVVPRFVKQAIAGEDITLWGAGTRAQTFTFVEDLARACELVWKRGVQDTFNITSGEVVTMKRLADVIVKNFPSAGSRVVFADKLDPQDGKRTMYSIDKARGRLGYEPKFSIDSGLARIAEHLRRFV